MNIPSLFYAVLNMVVTSINLMGVVIVVWGFIVASLDFIHLKLRPQDAPDFLTLTNKIRAVLGTYILLGLEFMIAADLIHTFVQPSQDDLIILATIVGIRTVISYFLGREVQEVREDEIQNKRRESRKS